MERDCASQHRSSAFFQSNTHVATQKTHTFLKHTQTQCPHLQILLSTRPSRLIQRRKSTSFSSPGGYVCSVNIPIGCVLNTSLFLGEMQAQNNSSLTHTFSLSFLQISSLKHDRRADLDEHIRPYQLGLVSSSARAKAYPRPRLN